MLSARSVVLELSSHAKISLTKCLSRGYKNSRKTNFERRRLRGDLILAHNIFHGRLDWPHAEFFRRKRSETFEGTTSSCAIEVFAYYGGKQPSL